MARRRKVRFSGRFYLTMLVLLGIVVALVLIIPSGGGGTLRNATMEAKLMPETVIIRNESTVAVDKFDMVDHLVDEGASVNAEVPWRRCTNGDTAVNLPSPSLQYSRRYTKSSCRYWTE